MSRPADNGGGGGSTPWYAYDVPTIWSLVKDQDTEALWNQVSGWKSTADLTSLHLSNLQEYREQLAEAWPPSRSPASQAYLTELDKLITSVQETHDRASSNHDAMVSIAAAASDAKYKLKPLFDEYQSNQQKLTEYQEQVDSYNADTTALPQPSPGAPPVPDGRQEQLNNQARSIMSGIGSEISLAATTIKPPVPYLPPKPRWEPPNDSNVSSGGSSAAGPVLVPPIVPPVVPAPLASPSTPNHSSAPFAPSTPPISSSTTPFGQGPILGSTYMPSSTVPPAGLTPIGSTPIPTGSLSPGPFAPPIIGPTTPGYGAPPRQTLSRNGLISNLSPSGAGGIKGLGSVAGVNGGTARPMPPGGVIGGASGSGLTQTTNSARTTPRTNPPGGVIGQQPTGGRNAAPRLGGAVGQQVGSGYMQHGRISQPQEEEDATLHWDPNNPWETSEGVAPVVLPSEDPTQHHPGPAIGRER